MARGIDHHRRRRRCPARSGRRSAIRCSARARSRSSRAMKSDEAEIERRLAADHVGDRTVDELADAEGDEERPSGVICVAAVDAPRSAAIVGSAGRYMSIANGPMAQSRPRTIAFRAKLDGMGGLFRDWRAADPSRPGDAPQYSPPLLHRNMPAGKCFCVVDQRLKNARQIGQSTALSLAGPKPLYSTCRSNPAMAINGQRNKPIGPGGSTRRLHHEPCFAFGLRRADAGGEIGSTRA